MKSLLICEYLPGTEFGASHRAALFKAALDKLGECRVLHLARTDEAVRAGLAHYWAPAPYAQRTERLSKYWHRLSFGDYRRDRRYARYLRSIRSEFAFDLAFCTFFTSSVAAPLDSCPCFVDADSIDLMSGRIARLLRPAIERRMRRWANRFTGIYLIRSSDKRRLGPSLNDRITLVPGVSSVARPLPPLAVKPKNVLFVGATWWAPNREAIERLLTHRVPEIINPRGLTLRLVGSGTEKIASRPGLSCAGFVDDLAAEYQAAALVICPTRIQTGANIKLAEALQYGCAVLASKAAVEAFSGIVKPDIDLACFDCDNDLVTRLLSLLEDEPRLKFFRERANAVFADKLNPTQLASSVSADIQLRYDSAVVRSVC